MRATTRRASLFILLAVLGLALGCPAGGGDTEGTGGTGTGEGGTTTNANIPEYYRFPINANIPTLDPAQVTDTVSSSVVSQLFDGLVKITPDGQLEPNLAESYEVAPDGLTYTFTLREGLKFHNGRAVTAADVVYSLDRILDPATGSPKTLFVDPVLGSADRMNGKTDATEGLIAQDDRTVVIKLHDPNALFPWYLAQSTCVVVPKENVENPDVEWVNHPVGTGPFKLGPEDYNFAEGVTLVANPDYHRGAPKLKGIRYVVEKEEKKRFEGFKAGLYEHTDIPPTEIEDVLGDPELAKLVVSKPTFDHYHIAIQCEKEPFRNNPTLRKALNHAIDKEHIATTLLKNTRVVADSYLPNNFPNFTPQHDKGYAYDPVLAAKLLADAGYPEGKGLPPLKLWFSTDETHIRIMEAVQQDLVKLGVQVELKSLEWSSFLEAMDAGEHDLGQTTWLMDYPDPDNILYVLFDSRNKGAAGNQAFYGNDRVDALVRQAQVVADPTERRRMYEEAEGIIYDEAPWILLLNRQCMILKQPYVSGLELTTLDRAPVIPGVDFETVSME